MVRGHLGGLAELAQANQLATPTLTVIGQVVGLFAGQDLQFPARYLAQRAAEQSADSPALVCCK